MIVKNTYGTSVAFSVREFGVIPKSKFTGSALQRKKQPPKEKPPKEATANKPKSEKPKEVKLRFFIETLKAED